MDTMRRRLASGLVASIVRAAAFASVTGGLVGLALGAPAARAALPDLAVLTTGPAVPAATVADRGAAPSPSRRQRDLDDLRRQDVARDLQSRGLNVRWQEHPVAELLDWRDRVDAARALAADFGVKVDWRAESAAGLTDMRLRAAKAAELQAAFGLVLDWRRYSWSQLERVRSSLAGMTSDPSRGATTGGGRAPARSDALYRDALAPFEPNRKARRGARNFRDRDAIIEPLFASTLSSRAAMRVAALHPDGILEPDFSRPSPRPSERGADALVKPRL